jgi:hypothetical protein
MKCIKTPRALNRWRYPVALNYDVGAAKTSTPRLQTLYTKKVSSILQKIPRLLGGRTGRTLADGPAWWTPPTPRPTQRRRSMVNAQCNSNNGPVPLENCGACHNPDNPKNRVDFLKAKTAADLESRRGLWRDVAAEANRSRPASHRGLGGGSGAPNRVQPGRRAGSPAAAQPARIPQYRS